MEMLLKQRNTRLKPQEIENLVNVATILMGIEPFVVTKDVCHLNNKESKQVLHWGLEKIIDSVIE